ncbi:LEPR-XLL domain-containing protein [Endozoicomonas sp.]|uniref:LEPR-XLL domain-containing protein n=1 Tax=Endozoicomonas sp. TaxID=1892382 RepID=UPI003AF43E2C
MHKKNKAQGSEQHQLEALEERILLSADPLLISFADSSEQTTETTIFQVAEQSTIATPDERKKEDPFQGLEAQPLNTLALSNNNLSVDGELIATDQDVLVIDQDQELSGNGSFQGHLINNGVMGPGNSPGIVELDSVTYNARSELVIEIGGKESDQFDQVKVDNLAQLGGKLTIKVIDGFSLKDGDSFQIMSFGSVEGQFESADGLFGLEGGSGYFQIVQSENGLELVYRELGNGLAIDFASQNDADAFGEKLNSHYFNNTDPLEGQARIQFSEFIYFQGNLHVDYGVANDMTVATGFPISLDLPAELNGLDRTYLTLSMTNASGFIGLGGPDKVDLNYDGDFDDEGEVNSQAKGIVLQDVNLGMAYFNLPADFFDLSIDLPDLATLKDIPNDVLLSTLPSFYALKADIGSIEVVGFSELFSLSAGHTTISINGAGSWLPASGVALDFATSFDGGLSVPIAGGADPIILDFAGAQQMSATLFDAQMSLLDFVHVYGDLTLEKGLAANVNVATGLPSDVSELIGLIGADSAAAAFIEGLESPSTINDLEVAGLSIAGSGLKAFVGVSGGFDSEGNLTSGATGLALSGVDFAYVDFTPTNPALSELLNFQAISATATSVEAVGIDQLTVSATDIRIKINTGKSWPGGLGTAVIDFGSSFLAENADNDADGDGKIDPAGYEVKAGSQSIYIDYDGNERIAASLNQAELNVGGFVTASGDFSFQKGPTHTVNVKVPNGVVDDSYNVEVESLQIGGQNITVFAGIGGIGFDSGSNINDRAIGILLSDVDFAYASFKPTGLFGSGLNASFQALSVLADSGQFVGLGDIAELSDVRVAFNSGKLFGGTTVTPYINFAGSGFDDPLGYAVQTSSDINDKIYLNFDSNQQLIAAHGSINLAGLVTVNGAFAFNKVKAVSVDVSSNIDEVRKALGVSGDFQLGGDIDVLTVGISDATVEVDLGVAGATLEGVTGALFLGTPTLAGLVPGSQQYVPKFVALKVNAQSVTSDSLAFNLSGSNIVFEANFTQFPGVDPTTQAILNAVAAPAIDFSSSFDEKQYDVAIGPTETIALAFAGQAFRLAIEQATVKIKNPFDGSAVVEISGGIAIERLSAQTVTLTDNTTLDEVDGITLVGKNLNASINLGELNVDLGAEAEVGLALMRANTSDFYFALTAEISDAFELDIPGVNFTPTGAEININTKLNRDFSNPSELLDPPAIDFANSYTGELARGIDLNGNGKLDKFGLILPTTDNDVVNSAVLLNFSDHLLVVRGQGTFRFDAFSQVYLEGTFESALVGTTQNIFFDGKLKVSYGAGELEFYSKGLMVSQVDSENPENSFLAMKLSTQGGFEIPGVIAFDGGFEFTANTTDREITFEVAEDFQPLLGYSTVTIGGISGFQLRSTEGSLTLVDTFSIDGGVLISAGTSSGLNVAVDGNIGLLGLGTLKASGDIALNDRGINTNLSLDGQAKILNLITIGGDFNLSLEMDGFKSVPSIELAIANPNIQFWSLFTLSPGGSVSLSFENGIFALEDLTANVDLDLINSAVKVDHIRSNGDLKFSFEVGGGFNQSLGIFSIGASAKAVLKVQHSNGEFDIDADMSVSASISSKAVTAKIFGKTITIIPSFSKSGTISGGLDLSLDPSDGELSIGANIFGKVDISIPIGFKLPLPDAPPPNVAAISGSTVTVHVGNKSSLRSYDKEDVNETVRIRQDGSKLIVDVQGKITKLDVGSGDYTINLDAGNGLDKVIVDSSVKGKINITNTESVKYSGSGLAIITGTSGNDSISIYGNGTAVINSGAGNDNVTIDSSGRTTIDLGIGNDVISLTGTGSHTLTPGTGDDRIHTAIVGGSLQLILAEGFGNDILSGNGTLSRLDMSQLTSDINLEYDYQNSKLLMNSEGGNLTLESGDTPQIDRIDFGSGNDTYVIVSAFDMTLTENGGDNAFYYVESAGGTANFSGNQFSLNGRTITYDQNISQFVLGNMDYSLVKEGGAFKGTVSYRLASGSETLTLRNSGGTYALPEARVEIFSNSVHFSSNFSALSWAISSKVDAVFNANLTATDGDIAIDQTSTDGVVTLSGNLTSSNGMIDIAAVGSIVQTAGTLTTSTSGRQIQLRSAQGSFEQRNGSRVIATNGVITVVANQWIDIAHLQAGTGEITLNAETGGIYDAGDTDVDIQSETLVFKAAEGFGTNENDIDTDIERINGSTGAGAINIQENDSLEVMAEGLSVLTSGNILMNNLNGNLTANGRISIKDTGNIRLKADNGSIETYADIQTAGANAITLQARNNITQHAYTTISTGEGGSVDAIAELVGVEQHDGALITTGNTGSIRLQAQGAIKVAGLHVAMGDVSLISVAGAITDSGDQNIDVLADQLRMSAGVGAGARDDALDISVDVLAARAGSGGIHLNEANTIHIDTLTDITVQRVQADGSLVTVTDAGISDLATSDNGDISLTSQDGDILVFNGSEHEDNAGIVANGSGDISLIASKGNITITENTDVISERGDVTLLAELNVLQEAGAGIIVSDSANGKQVRIEAVTGSVRQQDTSFIETVDSNIKVRAGQHIDVASIRTGEATVTMEAISGGIYDAGDSDLDIVAENLEFTANDAFGVNNDDIDTQIANVFGHVASGTINIQEEDSLNIHKSGLSIANDGDILVHSKSGGY